MTNRFVPLSVRGDDGAASERRSALHEGIPAWLRESAMGWVLSQLATKQGTYTNGRPWYQLSRHALLRLERDLEIQLNWQKGTESAGGSLQAMLLMRPELCLDVLDYLLHSDLPYLHDAADRLDSMLSQAGSAWRVAPDGEHFSLQRRVDESVQSAVDVTIADGGRASSHLARAWSAAYGRNPSPSESYRDSIRAVEAAAQPVVSPSNGKATLGTMLADLRNKPEKWALVFKEHRTVDPVIALIAAMWKGQFDRHGTPDPGVPIAVSQEEAEAAVHAAALLVRWFTTGAVSLVDRG